MATIDPLSGFHLNGKRALITGAGGGIGRALVALFHAAGATVMGADIKASAMDGLELADRLVFDLADPDAVEEALAPLEGAGWVTWPFATVTSGSGSMFSSSAASF